MTTISVPVGGVRKKSLLWDYLTTVDHKKIAHLYFWTGLVYFLIGGLEALLIRTQLAVPLNHVLVGKTYNEVLSMHGTTMIFFVAMPLLFALMNAVVPLQIGARDLAFPFVNALSYWLYFFGALLTHIGFLTGDVPQGGWTGYFPLAHPDYTGYGMSYYAMGLQLSGLGTLLTGINFVATIVNHRAPGMTYMRMPLFTWTTLIASILIMFAFPPLTAGLFLMIYDQLFGGAAFDPARGGNPIIWQHLFWIFGHPEVYIVVLPAFGIFSEVIPVFSRKRLFGYPAMVVATALIAFFGFMVWVHHMFTVGLGPLANGIFAIATTIIAVPTGIKIFNWIATMWGGKLHMTTAMTWAVGFIFTFVIGGVTGVMMALPPADYQYHDTYFIVAHFHYTLIGATVFSIFAGAYYWWPKMFGKLLNETLGKIHFWLFFIGFHLTFFIQHFLGLWGMQRRIYTYLPGQGFELPNLVSTIGAYTMALGVIVFAINIVYTFVKGKPAPADPWDGRTLEWATPTPVPEYNFARLPLIRGLDPFWLEKQAGNKTVPPAEPYADIHMPNPSILPFLMSLSLFIAGLGFIFKEQYHPSFLYLALFGVAATLFVMFLRSVIDDEGRHVPRELVEQEDAKGVSA
ncbi:MAG: cytochrome c oxidase subunit I [Hydrogenibacillus schlegelii]|nr:cytochrome c oxidase subunit I [Hydrogenibacillus schlegelii]